MRTASDESKCPLSKIGVEFNPFNGEQLTNPYPFYARARNEEPVFFSSLLQTWYITRYDDILTVLNDPVSFASGDPINAPFDYKPKTENVADGIGAENHEAKDSPASCSLFPLERISQTWIRRALNKAFRLGQIGKLDTRVREIAKHFVDGFATRGHAEFVSEFSVPMPMSVILNVLGSNNSDPMTVKRWSDDWVALNSKQLTRDEAAGPTARLMEAQKYWLRLIDERMADPSDDLLSCLIVASEEEDRPVALQQIVNTCFVIALAGYETTTNLLSICLYHILSTPEQWRLVREDKANIPRAVEETLRVDAPVQAMIRTTTRSVEVAGVGIPPGARVALCFGSANHDEIHFPDAGRFDLRREYTAGHLGFGQGLHSCLGAPLARLEACIALEILIERLPGLRLAPGHETVFAASPIYRSIKELPIEWCVAG